MNTKILVLVICIEVITYFWSYNLHDCNCKRKKLQEEIASFSLPWKCPDDRITCVKPTHIASVQRSKNFYLRQNIYNLEENSLKQSKDMQPNWTRLDRFKIYVCVFFDYYCQSLISGRKTSISPPEFEIFYGDKVAKVLSFFLVWSPCPPSGENTVGLSLLSS